MIFFGNIFASSYKFYSRKKGTAALTRAKSIVFLTQTFMIYFGLLLFDDVFKSKLFSFLISYPLSILIPVIAVGIFSYIYYSKDRLDFFVKKFESKKLSERRIWAVITAVAPLIPIITFFIIDQCISK